ncbi:MAG: IS110 family transposase [Acidobacteriia bacterium]|nr:IS110 family transposase [Terriglobia bacterium]
MASYLGLLPGEESSGDRVASRCAAGHWLRLGHISKQGNTLLLLLMVEAAQVTVRSDPEWRRK